MGIKCGWCGKNLSKKTDEELSWNREPLTVFCNGTCHSHWNRCFGKVFLGPPRFIISEEVAERAGELASLDQERGGETLSLAYLMEEVGEVSRALVDGDGENYREELLDVVLAALGMYVAADGKLEDIGPTLEAKLKKWADKLGHCGFCYNGEPSKANPNDEESVKCSEPQLTGNIKQDIQLVLNIGDTKLLKTFLKRCWTGGKQGGPMLTYEEERQLQDCFKGFPHVESYIAITSEIAAEQRPL